MRRLPLILGLLLGTLGNTPALPTGYKIGYGSSDAVLPAKTHELFYLGFELGLSASLQRPDVASLIAVEHVWDGSALGAQRSAEKLLAGGVVALAGYPTSHEALLAAKPSTKAGVMGVFAAARHTRMGELGRLVVSTVPSMRSDIEAFLKLIEEKHPGKRGILINNRYNVFCQNQTDLILELTAQDPFRKMDFTVVQVDKEHQVADADLGKIKKGKFDYVYNTLYPDMSLRLLGQLESVGVDLPIFANASWTTDDFELIRRTLVKHKSPLYSISLWVPGSKTGQAYERGFKKRFGRAPSSEGAHGFDLGLVVGQTLQRVSGTPTAQSFVDAFYQSPCFEGSSSGKICFPPTGGHAIRALHVLRFVEGSFVAQ